MSLNASYDDDNIMAKILRGEIPNTTIYEDDDVLAFMDIFPQSKGHCLVIPKNTKAVNLFDMPDDDLAILIQRTRKIATAVKQALQPDGIRIAQFNGSAAGQTIFHLHFHIIPSYEGNKEAAHGGAGRGQADPGELAALAEKIKAALT